MGRHDLERYRGVREVGDLGRWLYEVDVWRTARAHWPSRHTSLSSSLIRRQPSPTG